MGKQKITWLLIKYYRYQTDTTQRRGEIIMRGKTPNGFIEKIFELSFDRYIYSIQRQEKGSISYSIQIGDFANEKAENEMNSKIADASMKLLPLLNLLSDKNSGKHFEEIEKIQMEDSLNFDRKGNFKPPTVGQFREYCISLIPKGKGVKNERFEELYNYFKNNNWNIGGKKMKDWKVAAKREFKKLIS